MGSFGEGYLFVYYTTALTIATPPAAGLRSRKATYTHHFIKDLFLSHIPYRTCFAKRCWWVGFIGCRLLLPLQHPDLPPSAPASQTQSGARLDIGSTSRCWLFFFFSSLLFGGPIPSLPFVSSLRLKYGSEIHTS
jgi:hypothetical protein